MLRQPNKPDRFVKVEIVKAHVSIASSKNIALQIKDNQARIRYRGIEGSFTNVRYWKEIKSPDTNLKDKFKQPQEWETIDQIDEFLRNNNLLPEKSIWKVCKQGEDFEKSKPLPDGKKIENEIEGETKTEITIRVYEQEEQYKDYKTGSGQLIGELLWYRKVLYTNGLQWRYFELKSYSEKMKELPGKQKCEKVESWIDQLKKRQLEILSVKIGDLTKAYRGLHDVTESGQNLKIAQKEVYLHDDWQREWARLKYNLACIDWTGSNTYEQFITEPFVK